MFAAVAAVSFTFAPTTSDAFIASKMEREKGGGAVRQAGIVLLVAGVLTSLIVAGVGVLFLDEELHDLELTTVTPEEAIAAGLTQAEFLAYNANVAIFNSIIDELRLDSSITTAEEAQLALNYYFAELGISLEAQNGLNKLFLSLL